MMDSLFMPSLENLSYVEISLAVFYHPDVYRLVSDYYIPPLLRSESQKQRRIILKRILSVVRDKISALRITPSFHMKVRSLIFHMARELWLWKQSLRVILNIDLLKDVRPLWTKQLTIDRVKTAKALARNTNFGIADRFRLACKYCLFYDALDLRNMMTADEKSSVLPRRDLQKVSALETWICDPEFEAVRGDLASFITFAEVKGLRYNEHLMSLILSTKSLEDRRQILKDAVSPEFFKCHKLDFKLFCLQQLGKNYQDEVLKTNPVVVLVCLLFWPFENNFLDVAYRAWVYLSPKDFCYVLETFICNLSSYEWQNYELVEILKQFWDRSPANFKECARQTCVFGPLKILLSCNSRKSLNSNTLEDAYRKYATDKFMDIVSGLRH